MQTKGHIRGPDISLSRRWFRWIVSSLTVFSLVAVFASMGAAQSDGFEIIIPIDTVVRAPEGSVTVLNTTDTPGVLVGETCLVAAQSENQSSVHPGNDLVIEGDTSIVLEDVEAEPGATVVATETMVLSDDIVISLIMGPDEVFSAGIQVQFDCPPEQTTTTISSTTTTSGDTTTTISGSTTTSGETTTTSGETTTTISNTTITTSPSSTSSTTTTEASTTTASVTSTTTPGATTSTDEVLAYTGPEDNGLGAIAVALAAIGAMVLIGERSFAYSPAARSLVSKRCSSCDRNAVFMTPHGGMCLSHTRSALNGDDVLWMPRRLR